MEIDLELDSQPKVESDLRDRDFNQMPVIIEQVHCHREAVWRKCRVEVGSQNGQDFLIEMMGNKDLENLEMGKVLVVDLSVHKDLDFPKTPKQILENLSNQNSIVQVNLDYYQS